MFTIKKIISAFIMPLSIGLVLGLIGLYFLYTKSYKKAKFFLTISFIWIVVISYQPFSNMLLEPLESKYEKLESIPSDVEYLLLLGGDKIGRSYEVIRLYNMNKDLKIITSGWEGSREIPEAILNRDFLLELGIPKEKIFTQSEPRDTKEEAIYTKKIVGDKRFILVTAATHMDRAIKLFKKEGLDPIAAPTNFLHKEDSYKSIPKGINLLNTEISLHEYIGKLWHKLKGDI